jgi:hypothetical protein
MIKIKIKYRKNEVKTRKVAVYPQNEFSLDMIKKAIEEASYKKVPNDKNQNQI